MVNKKALLVILDGWGFGDHSKRDVIYSTTTPYWDYLLKTYPYSQLQASGENVGLPDGQMGNSEVGHLNIGAGRIVYQDLVKINIAARDNSILKNPAIQKAYSYAREHKKKIHLMGLVSNGGVHSSLEHLFKLTEISKIYGVENTFVHCFMDGRDTDPKSGAGFIRELEEHLQKTTGKIASIVGRYYAMDRDKRWERVKEAYDLLVSGIGTPTENPVEAVEKSYAEGVTDEFIKPIVHVNNGKPVAVIEEGDVVIFFNYRNDRAKELTVALSQQDLPEQEMHTIANLQYFTMTPYDPTYKNVHVIFDKENVENTLGEYLSSLKLKQLHIAETEKYAHVTFFFNGGREAPYEGEERILVPSPKVATYDLQPEMSAYEVKDKLVAAINSQQFDFIVVNYANGDMVGHTGVYGAIEKAIVAVDACLKDTIEAAKANGYEAIIIADHGNADYALNDDNTPNTAHSLNPVPFIYVSENAGAKTENGRLADVAPSILHILGLSQPAEMTGHNLIH
ncbi:MAG: 2,3-bisphosphoglycerate-independent phosphoglycerate mutase [Dysgonamonadaceae bacterium]|jgi:2,3-bisphosphoglycerate-independent phosphoglycerate mutase|nr:2,3-bisphosphoglycerate-independent phosphoglycerate mutase [Dysgonamonadaceae bacterium]